MQKSIAVIVPHSSAKPKGRLLSRALAVAVSMAVISVSASHAVPAPKTETQETAAYEAAYKDFALLHSLAEITDPNEVASAVFRIDQTWKPAYIPALLESVVYGASRRLSIELLALMEEKTGQNLGGDINAWYQWLWNQPEMLLPGYADFKAGLYRTIDPRFETYFNDRQNTAYIRLDEIRWGGVQQDGIPPLRNPNMIRAKDAAYLDDDHVVFGIEINGDARAYPKRILAWHEMFVDTIGGIDIAGVYCTLCGTVIPYKTEFNGVKHTLGTSGFLYRSNKLMYDKETQSLWNTIKGEPVLGPLAGKGIALEHLSVVTTTWGEWKRRHPKTSVLSIDTGHRRDYGEGVAYNTYFATDELMFNTPFNDTRLENKQEVLALRFTASPHDQLAIDTDFLAENPLYTDQIGTQKVLVLTDATGANRVYDPKDVVFTAYDQQSTITDATDRIWTLSESALIANDGTLLERLPYHRAFWFGWYATYPETRLVK